MASQMEQAEALLRRVMAAQSGESRSQNVGVQQGEQPSVVSLFAQFQQFQQWMSSGGGQGSLPSLPLLPPAPANTAPPVRACLPTHGR